MNIITDNASIYLPSFSSIAGLASYRVREGISAQLIQEGKSLLVFRSPSPFTLNKPLQSSLIFKTTVISTALSLFLEAYKNYDAYKNNIISAKTAVLNTLGRTLTVGILTYVGSKFTIGQTSVLRVFGGLAAVTMTNLLLHERVWPDPALHSPFPNPAPLIVRQRLPRDPTQTNSTVNAR